MDMRDERIFFDGVSAEELAATYGTPLYVLEADTVRRRLRSLEEHIVHRPLRVYYACKANWNVSVISLLRELGTGLDVCSSGDVHLGLKAGFAPSAMIYTGYAVTRDELRLIQQLGIVLNVDSLSQIERYAQIGGRGTIGLRINTGVSAGFHTQIRAAEPDSKFGVHPSQVRQAVQLARSHGLTIDGLHTHLGSDILEVAAFVSAIDILLELAAEIDTVSYIDLGGGLGIQYAPDETPIDLAALGVALTDRLAQAEQRRGAPLALYLEPGEWLATEAGWLLTRVTDVKPGFTVDRNTVPTFVGTDTSMNHAFAAAVYGGYREILVNGRVTAAPVDRVYVCGNLMQGGDVLARHRPLPPIYEGDLLVLANCGSYAMARASQFNARPLPAEVLVDVGQARLIRRRQTVEDLLRDQLLP